MERREFSKVHHLELVSKVSPNKFETKMNKEIRQKMKEEKDRIEFAIRGKAEKYKTRKVSYGHHVNALYKPSLSELRKAEVQ